MAENKLQLVSDKEIRMVCECGNVHIITTDENGKLDFETYKKKKAEKQEKSDDETEEKKPKQKKNGAFSWSE